MKQAIAELGADARPANPLLFVPALCSSGYTTFLPLDYCALDSCALSRPTHPNVSDLGARLLRSELTPPPVFRLAQWLILQATTEQSTFAAMICYHLSTYLKTQNHRPGLQRSLLRASWRLLKFTEVITFPQKIVPAGMALYWLARMWHDIDSTTDGRFWLGWATSLISVLLLLQVKFCDDVFPICN